MTKNRKIGAVILAATTVNILVAMAYGFSTYGWDGVPPVWWDVWVLMPAVNGALFGGWFFFCKQEK